MTKETDDITNVAVLAILSRCGCGHVSISMDRRGIDHLSHGGEVTVPCGHCGQVRSVRAANDMHAPLLLPELLPCVGTELIAEEPAGGGAEH